MAKSNRKARRQTVFGKSMTSVIRALGKSGWSFQQARTALRKKRVKPSDATIRIMLSAGKLGQRGEPAKLDRSEIATLKHLAAA